ncbi:MAG TPA: polysaccharide deacetylase family protein [Sporichthya sp.]|nr:polysaccharide deacetylase family protein [Sporichthya sp.]
MRRAIGVLAAGALLTACTGNETRTTPLADVAESPAASASASPSVDPASVSANELGHVPVLMYHQVIDNARRVEDGTPADFRAQLQRLYDEGYRPVTAVDYVTGQIDLPAGTHPVVLTFDDSTISQAQIGPDSEPTPDTALGMLEAFGREHPDFHPTATFYVNTYPEPYVDGAVLPWLAAHGYEIGAHTRSHAALRRLDDAGVQAEIGRNATELEAAVPGYRVRTFATPYGVWPVNRELARAGTHDGVPYEFDGVFGVDEINAYSPFSVAFDPYAVPRVGAGADADAALARLRAQPELRYTCDGDPEVISFPAADEAQLAPGLQSRARPY